jgi:ankyrin repeat protein
MSYSYLAQTVTLSAKYANATDKYGWTKLHLVAANDAKVEAMKLLVEKGADVNATTKDELGLMALHLVAAMGVKVDSMKFLVDKGANVNATDKDGWTVLHYVAHNSANLDAMKFLIDNGADVNATDMDGKTALNILVKRHPNKLDEKMSLLKSIDKSYSGPLFFCDVM